jgi:hypothetical protein
VILISDAPNFKVFLAADVINRHRSFPPHQIQIYRYLLEVALLLVQYLFKLSIVFLLLLNFSCFLLQLEIYFLYLALQFDNDLCFLEIFILKVVMVLLLTFSFERSNGFVEGLMLKI